MTPGPSMGPLKDAERGVARAVSSRIAGLSTTMRPGCASFFFRSAVRLASSKTRRRRSATTNGFEKNPSAPDSLYASERSVSVRNAALINRMPTLSPPIARICFEASRPFSFGNSPSTRTTCGRSLRYASTPALPSAAWVTK